MKHGCQKLQINQNEQGTRELPSKTISKEQIVLKINCKNLDRLSKDALLSVELDRDGWSREEASKRFNVAEWQRKKS